jgi:plasmid stabilization system protein ParE
MRSLRLRKTAREEIEDAFEWYGRQSATAPIRFLLALDEALANIRERPESFPVVTGSLRRTLLRRFPYAVYFKIYQRTISVVGVIHGHRHPRTWLRREP